MAGQVRESITGLGAYSVSFASKLIELNPQTIRRWLFGHAQSGSSYSAVAHAQLPLLDGHYAVSFLDLMELRVIHQFLELGVSLQMIRKVTDKARILLRTDYPYSTRLFRTDGRTIFADLEGEAPEALLEVISDQWVFEDVIGPSLHDLDYPNEKEASSPHQWWVAGRDRQIIVDPRRAFGMPVIREGSISTRLLANMVDSNDITSVAALYDVPEEAVSDAVDFEVRLAA